MALLLLAALACDLCAVGLLLYAVSRGEVDTMAAKQTVTRADLLVAEAKLELALGVTRAALKLCEPEGQLVQKGELDACNAAGNQALDAGNLLKGA